MSSTKAPVDTPDELDQHWMAPAIELARIAQAQGEVPVGALLVKDERVLAAGYNRPLGPCQPTAPAQLVAPPTAAAHTANYRPSDRPP